MEKIQQLQIDNSEHLDKQDKKDVQSITGAFCIMVKLPIQLFYQDW